MDLETTRPFFIIFSNRTLENLTNLINKYYDKYIDFNGESNLIRLSLLTPDKFKGEATDRTITVMDEKIFQSLKEDEVDLDNFQIERFQIRQHFHPNKSRGDSTNFYLPLPKNLSLTTCQTHILERMESLRTIGLWKKNDYSIKFPSINRLEDKNMEGAYIYFNKLTNQDSINDVILSRIYINNTKWPETNQEVHCFWARKKTDSVKTTSTVEVTTSKVVKSTTVESSSDTTSTSEKNTDNKNVWIEKQGKHK